MWSPYGQRIGARVQVGGAAQTAAREKADVTARFLLEDLGPSVTEDELRDYFTTFGELEEVSIKYLEKKEQYVGSIKFAEPTFEIRNMMLKETHVIGGNQLVVQTWKMRKMEKPGYAEKRAQEVADRKVIQHAEWQSQAVRKIVPMSGAIRQPMSGAIRQPQGRIPGSGFGATGFGATGAACSKGFSVVGKGAPVAYPGVTVGYGSPYGRAPCVGKGKVFNGPYGILPFGGGAIAPYEASYGPAKGRFGGPIVPKGGKGSGKKELDDTSIASRFNLADLPIGVDEETLRSYFSEFGEIEDVKIREGNDGRVTGSVKFSSPTRATKGQMLNQPHEIDGQVIKVQTWKMMKTEKQQYSAARAAEAGALEEP